MLALPVLPAIAVLLVIVDMIFVTSWSGVLALIGALVLLEPLFLAREDDESAPSATPDDRRKLPSLDTLKRIPAALGTLSRVRRYLLVLFILFFALRLVALVIELGADDATQAAFETAIRLYDAALAVTGLLLAVLHEELHRLGKLALFLAHRPGLLLLTTFAALIAVGAMLLLLPIAVSDPSHISFVDAVFTMTSAVCVNGLVANDFAAVYTDFGHVFTLIGIQLGGLGIMTIAALAATFGRGSLERQSGFSAALEAKSLADLRHLVRAVIIYTFSIEAIGTFALWMHWRDAPWLGDESALWLAAFHAVSAFCNAGFSLFSDSFSRFSSDGTTQAIIVTLVFTGGIGFSVLRELYIRAKRLFLRRVLRRPLPWRRTPVGIKVAVVTHLVLLLAGALLIGATEHAGELAPLSAGEQALNATFTSAMPRSAGFNTLDMTRLADPTLLVLIVLMFIGGSPGSTAGGIKTTTFLVLLATLRAELRGREPELYGRAIAPRTIRRAVAVSALTLIFIVVVLFFLVALEPELPFLNLTFEAVSAVATTGLSTGITASLSDAAKLVVTLAMFVGRIGPLTVANAVGREVEDKHHRLATEELVVG